jgi:predicted transcriptional regulator
MAELRELHIRISGACFKKIQEVADENESSISTVCRQALWLYVRTRVRGLSQTRRTINQGR